MRMLPNHPKQYIRVGLVPMLQDLAIHLIETLTDNPKRIHSTLIFALKKTGRCSGLIVSKTFSPFKLVSEDHSPCQCFTMWRVASSSNGPNDCHTHHQIDQVASRTTQTQLLYITWNMSSTHTVGAYRKYAGFILTAQCIGGMAPQLGASTKLYRDLYRTTAREDFVTALRAIPPTAVKPIYSHLHPVGKPQNCTLGSPHCDRTVTFMVYAFSITTEAPTCWGQQISRQANSCVNSNLKWLKELSEPEGG